MSRIDDPLIAALRALPPKPPDGARQADKKAYSEAMSARIAMALASELRGRGTKETRLAQPGALGLSGAERRLAGVSEPRKWTSHGRQRNLACSWASVSRRSTSVTAWSPNATSTSTRPTMAWCIVFERCEGCEDARVARAMSRPGRRA